MEFLSPHANIYESTHAHYDRTICICILLIDGFQSRDETAMVVDKTIISQIMARILHNNRVKFPKDFFSIALCTNMAAMTSSENHL